MIVATDDNLITDRLNINTRGQADLEAQLALLPPDPNHPAEACDPAPEALVQQSPDCFCVHKGSRSDAYAGPQHPYAWRRYMTGDAASPSGRRQYGHEHRVAQA